MNEKKDVFEFGPYRLQVAERRLWRDGSELVSLPPKVFDLLVLLVENSGRLLEKNFLLESLWPGTFVEEANLSVNISLLRKALREGESYIETVPKRGYRFNPPLAPEKPAPVPPPPAAPPRRRSLPWAAVAIASLLAGVLGWWSWTFFLDSSPVDGLHSLAVLPFYPLDGNAGQNYLGLGMAEALITRLSTIRRIVVRPTSAVLKYSDMRQDSIAAGRELGVDAVLVGSMQHSESRIRITVRLYRTRDGAALWGEKFDDNFHNIFSVQDSISERVAALFAAKLTESELQRLSRRSTDNSEAYQYYLQGRYLATKRLKEATEGAIEYYRKAVEKDPDYALPYAEMATAYVRRAGEGLGDELRGKAKTAALKAISLAENLPEAQVALGEVLMRADWDWSGADRAFNRAIALNPNLPAAHASKSILLTAFGRHDEAIREMEAACKLEPSSAVLRSDLAWTFEFSRRYEEAAVASRESVALDPWSYTPRRQLAKALLMLGQYQAALDESRKTMDIAGGHNRRILAELGKVYAAWGKTVEARKILAELRQRSWQEPDPHYEMAVFLAALGDRSAALDALRSAVDMRLTRVIWMNADPELDGLRDDPRFRRLLRQMRLVPE